MLSPIQGLATVLGRLMIVTIFVASVAGNKIPNFAGVVQYMRSAGVPSPQLLLVGAIAFMSLGSLSVLLGYKTRLGAGLLLAFLVLATSYFHAFWNLQGQEQQLQMIQFMKNFSMAGAMVFLMANGPGPLAMDTRTVRSATPVARTAAQRTLEAAAS